MASGSIQEVTIECPGRATRRFSVAADADSNRKLGGYESEVRLNGDGTGQKKMTRIAGKLDGLTLDVINARGDQEFLQDVADSPDMGAMTITYVDGTTYQGSGTITGELNYSSQNGTCGVTLEFTGKLGIQ